MAANRRRAHSPAEPIRVELKHDLSNASAIPLPLAASTPAQPHFVSQLWAWACTHSMFLRVIAAFVVLISVFVVCLFFPPDASVLAVALVAAIGWGICSECRRAYSEHGRAYSEHGCAALAQALAASEKSLFYVRMMAISSPSSGDTSSGVDAARLGAPIPVVMSEETFFAPFPTVSASAMLALWTVCAAKLYATWTAPTGANLDENRDVHPVIAAVLQTMTSPLLRLWRNVLAEDDIPCAKIRPDFTVTHVRDAAVSVVGVLLAIEVTLLWDLESAVTQTCAYLRRRVYKVCCEREARSESCHTVFALGVATDGLRIVFIRVESGAPPPGGSYAHCIPCPVWRTEPIALFEGWNFTSKPDFRSSAPPPGFAALARLMSAPVTLFGGGTPLEELRAVIHLTARGGVATGNATFETLSFGERLGCGGASDVYEVVGGTMSTASAGCVVKVARSATAAVCQSYDAERLSLTSLSGAAEAGLVPELVGVGHRDPDNVWPLLVLRPRGKQLSDWVRECVSRKLSGNAELVTSASDDLAVAVSERRNCASIVARRLLEVLQTAHASKIIHCDVRPLNVVVVGDLPMLVDWGSSRLAGVESAGCGVAAYATKAVFAQKSFKARPAQDVAAVLFTWLSVAFDYGCVAPWLVRGYADDDAMFAARAAWAAARSSDDATIAAIIGALDVIESSPAQTQSAALVACAMTALPVPR